MARSGPSAVAALGCAVVLVIPGRAALPGEGPDGPETFGAESNPTGDPIGGGEGDRRIPEKGDFRVGTPGELLDALGKAAAGQVVYVADDAEIDLSGREGIVLPAGVTLASGRGRKGSKGGLLFSTALKTFPLFKTGGDGVRVTGLRLRGPDPERRTEQMRELNKEGKYYSIPNSEGLQSAHADLEVDNCELTAWSHAAVLLQPGAAKARIHHNDIHHNQRSGLGYGVCLDRAEALVEANRFDYNRHHVAGTGRPGTSYEARYNVVLENANGHGFDMHGGADRKDGTDVAGDRIRIHHNTVRAADVAAVVIRGRPREACEVHHNWFPHADPAKAVRQSNATGGLDVRRNQYSDARTVK